MSNYRSDDWINGDDVLGGKVALVRKNVSLANVPRGDYPYELIVHLVYEEIQDDGLPGSTEEIELLNINEEKVADFFCQHYDAHFALCVTSDGVRDLFLYLPKQLSESVLAHAFEKLALTIDYDYGIRKSRDWRIYSNALSSGSERRPWWKKLLGS